MALIVPGVARFAVNQTLAGRNVVNVLDYRIDTTGSTMSRDDAVAGQAGSIVEQWADLIVDQQVNDVSFVSVSWVDLNSSSGSTGTATTGGGYTLPVPGLGTAAPLPGNAAVLVRKNAGGGRATRSGRLYLAGMSEVGTSTTNGNELDPAVVSGVTAAFTSFLANTNEVDTFGTAFSSEMVVVHITARDADNKPIAGVGNPVTSMVCDPLLATQRRRLRP